MQPVRQARLPLEGEVQVELNSNDAFYVGVQNIALARVDVQPRDGTRRVLLNLFGTRDIDRLIEALEAARAHMVTQQQELNEYFRTHPDAVLP
jgi:hypothetical protein